MTNLQYRNPAVGGQCSGKVSGAKLIALLLVGAGLVLGGCLQPHIPTNLENKNAPETPGLGNGAEDYHSFVTFIENSCPAAAVDLANLNSSTYIGGGNLELAKAIASDTDGNLYLTGSVYNMGHEFITTHGAINRTFSGEADIFIMKLAADGTEIIYSTLLGSEGMDDAEAIAVDGDGCAYITGHTESPDTFPTTPGAINGTDPLSGTVFICKINEEGTALEYSTLLGGGGDASSRRILLDTDNNATIVGYANTNPNGFPTTPGAINTSHSGDYDIFLTKISATGTEFVFSTLFGGPGTDYGLGLADDINGSFYVTGWGDGLFPTTPGAINETNNGGLDMFIAKFNPLGTELEFSALIGGKGHDIGFDITVDGEGNTYVVGSTLYSLPSQLYQFPTTAGAPDFNFNDDYDLVACKINPTGTRLEYSAIFGGEGQDRGTRVKIDSTGSMVITGYSNSTGGYFPTTTKCIDEASNGDYDVLLLKIDPEQPETVYSTFFGGAGSDSGWDFVMTPADRIWLTGSTQSPDFPILPGALNVTHGGSNDIFLSQFILEEDESPAASFTSNPPRVVAGEKIQYTFTGSPGNPPTEILWDFGDGTPSETGANPKHIYGSPGTFTVNCTTVDQDGDSDTAESNITVEPDFIPLASFDYTVTDNTEDEEIGFIFRGTKGNEPADLQWNFGDGSVNTTGDLPDHIFTEPGNYTVRVTVTDWDGDISSSARVLVVREYDPVPGTDDPKNTIPGYFLMISALGAAVTIFKIAEKVE